MMPASDGGEAPAGNERAKLDDALLGRQWVRLIAEQSASALRVIAGPRMTGRQVGEVRLGTELERPAHERSLLWTLTDASGAQLSGASKPAAHELHVPPDPRTGAPAAHAPLDKIVYDVWVPVPNAGETLTLAAPEVNPAIAARSMSWP